MHLHHKLFGSPSSPPLMLIHGLFGSWENLKPLIKILTPYYHIIAIDARNHGQSPHDSSMTYTDMAQDIQTLRTTLGIGQFGILGHSMGGKIAMQVALTTPQNVQHLTVIDIAPKPYPPHHAAIIKAIGRIHLSNYTTKTQVAEALSSDIPNMALRQFLVKNIMRCDTQLKWRININAIQKNYADISTFPVGSGSYTGPTTFIRGTKSNYIDTNDTSIAPYFPNAMVKDVDASHWVHAENPNACVDHLSPPI